MHGRGFECFKAKVSIASDHNFLLFVALPVCLLTELTWRFPILKHFPMSDPPPSGIEGFVLLLLRQGGLCVHRFGEPQFHPSAGETLPIVQGCYT